MRLPFKYQSEIGYDCLIQNIVLKRIKKYNRYNNNRFRYRIENENYKKKILRK